jgi:hypothetical protein
MEAFRRDGTRITENLDFVAREADSGNEERR